VLPHGSFVMTNNIFHGNGFVFTLGSTGLADVTYESDHNLYFETSAVPAAFRFGTGPTISGLAPWREATGQDLHSIDGDPKFTGTLSSGQFGVASDSPAWALAAGADYEREECDEVLQEYRSSLTAGLTP
jgi:hypothetical protein